MGLVEKLQSILLDESVNPDNAIILDRHEDLRCKVCGDPFEALGACVQCKQPTCQGCMISGRCLNCLDAKRHATEQERQAGPELANAGMAVYAWFFATQKPPFPPAIQDLMNGLRKAGKLGGRK